MMVCLDCTACVEKEGENRNKTRLQNNQIVFIDIIITKKNILHNTLSLVLGIPLRTIIFKHIFCFSKTWTSK